MLSDQHRDWLAWCQYNVTEWVCNFCLSVSARTFVRADTSMTFTSTLSNHPTNSPVLSSARALGVMALMRVLCDCLATVPVVAIRLKMMILGEES